MFIGGRVGASRPMAGTLRPQKTLLPGVKHRSAVLQACSPSVCQQVWGAAAS